MIGGWFIAALMMVGLALGLYLIFRGKDEGIYSSYSPSFWALLIPTMIVVSIGVLGAIVSVLLGYFYRSPSGRMYRILSGLSLFYLVIGVVLFYGSLGSFSVVILITAVVLLPLVHLRRLLGGGLGAF